MTLSFAGQTSFKLTAFAVATPAPPNRDRFDRRAGERRQGDRRCEVIEVNFERRRNPRRRDERQRGEHARRADVTSWGMRETLSLDKPLVTDPDD